MGVALALFVALLLAAPVLAVPGGSGNGATFPLVCDGQLSTFFGWCAPERDNVYAACGFSGHGFMQAPAVGAAVAEELLTGASALDLCLVAAGTPIEALQGTDTLPVPAALLGPGEHYALEVAGDSMVEEGILDGDYALIRRTDVGYAAAIVLDDCEPADFGPAIAPLILMWLGFGLGTNMFITATVAPPATADVITEPSLTNSTVARSFEVD